MFLWEKDDDSHVGVTTNYTPTENNNPITQPNPPSRYDTRSCHRIDQGIM